MIRFLNNCERIIVELWRRRKSGRLLTSLQDLEDELRSKAIRIRIWEINRDRPHAIRSTKVQGILHYTLMNKYERLALGQMAGLRRPKLSHGTVVLPISATVGDTVWNLYEVEFKTAEGEFCTFIYAKDEGHARLIVRELRTTAQLGGIISSDNHFNSEDAGNNL